MGFLDKLKGNSASEVAKSIVEGAGNTVAQFVNTPEKKAELEKALQDEITKRWQADASGTWLTQNIRPLTLAWAIVNLTVLMWTDGNIGDFHIREAWLPVFESLLLTVVGGYFVLRTIDKRGTRL